MWVRGVFKELVQLVPVSAQPCHPTQVSAIANVWDAIDRHSMRPASGGAYDCDFHVRNTLGASRVNHSAERSCEMFLGNERMCRSVLSGLCPLASHAILSTVTLTVHLCMTGETPYDMIPRCDILRKGCRCVAFVTDSACGAVAARKTLLSCIDTPLPAWFSALLAGLLVTFAAGALALHTGVQRRLVDQFSIVGWLGLWMMFVGLWTVLAMSPQVA